jgi:hypothetical protein
LEVYSQSVNNLSMYHLASHLTVLMSREGKQEYSAVDSIRVCSE